MKKLLFTLIFMTYSFAFAQNKCVAEAQIIAKVGAVKNKGYFNCIVEVKEITLYSANQLCPLDIAEILKSGVDVGIKDGHDCGLSSGQDLTGVVFVGADGLIRLE